MKSLKLHLPIFVIVLMIAACRVSLNQKNETGQRYGKWIIEPSTDRKEIGWYKNGVPYRTWTYYSNNQLERKEVYRRNNKSKITLYQQNGKKYAQGFSKFDIGNDIHWFYTGKWKYYNQAGQLEYLRYFENGIEVQEKLVR